MLTIPLAFLLVFFSFLPPTSFVRLSHPCDNSWWILISLAPHLITAASGARSGSQGQAAEPMCVVAMTTIWPGGRVVWACWHCTCTKKLLFETPAIHCHMLCLFCFFLLPRFDRCRHFVSKQLLLFSPNLGHLSRVLLYEILFRRPAFFLAVLLRSALPYLQI